MTDASGLVRLVFESYVGQAATYFAIVGLIFFALWRLGERRFQGARIQEKRRVDGRQIRREVKHTLVTLLIGTLNAVAITLLYQAGLTRLSTDAAAWSWPVLALSFIGFIVFNDAWFYWWHRFLHRPQVFRRAHAVHHKSVDVNPFTSYSFHAFEAFILGAWAIPVLMLVPVYLPLLVGLQVAGLAKNIEAHLGYEFLPRWFVRVPPFKWLTTSTYHNLHHTRFNGNYALFFRGWDILLGTELPEYEQTFVDRGERRTTGAVQRAEEGEPATPRWRRGSSAALGASDPFGGGPGRLLSHHAKRRASDGTGAARCAGLR